MKRIWTMLLVAAIVSMTANFAGAASLEDLQKQIDGLNSQVKAIKEAEEVKAAKAAEEATSAKETKAEPGYAKGVWEKTRIGGYGELIYSFTKENGNGNGGQTFDPRRVVLYVNADLADWITMNTELEWEHGGSDGGADGGVSVEQAFLDFKLSREFNIKAGVMLVPVGAVNLYHEPTNFNSTERPQLDKYLIPTTWQEMGAGIHGSLGSRVDYQLLGMNGLNGTLFSAANGIRDGRQDFGKDVNKNVAVTGRLEVRPCTNLYTNFSFYSGNSAPSGIPTAYTTILAFDGKYNIGEFDIAGEYVQILQDKPAVLANSIGHRMSGYWVEGAYHIMPKSLKTGKLANADAVVFTRWSEFNTQDGGAIDPTQTSGLYDRNYLTFGLAFKPVPTVVVKADYQIYGDHRSAGQVPLDNDKFQLGLGFVF